MTGTENPDGYELAATDFLTEARLRSARPKAWPYKLRDGGGLYLLVTPSGAKQWRLRYTLAGRESMVSLARARRAGMHTALESGRLAPDGIHGRSDELPSIPCDGVDIAERDWLSARRHRAAACPPGAQRGASGVQPGSAARGASEDDAILGRLSGRLAAGR